MSLEEDLLKRSSKKCELCASEENLSVFEVEEGSVSIDECICVCNICKEQLSDDAKLQANHWHCLNDSMWSEVAVVQVVAYRILSKISHEGWPQDMLDMLYLDDKLQAWANKGLEVKEEGVIVKDANGSTLENGDSITIIKDLEVKGAGFTAKRGTVVKNISLGDDPTHIEGRVNGVKIYLKTCFLKKV